MGTISKGACKNTRVYNTCPSRNSSGGFREHHNGSSGVEGHSPGSMVTPFLISLLQGKVALGSNNCAASLHPSQGSQTLLQLALLSTHSFVRRHCT